MLAETPASANLSRFASSTGRRSGALRRGRGARGYGAPSAADRQREIGRFQGISRRHAYGKISTSFPIYDDPLAIELAAARVSIIPELAVFVGRFEPRPPIPSP